MQISPHIPISKIFLSELSYVTTIKKSLIIQSNSDLRFSSLRFRQVHFFTECNDARHCTRQPTRTHNTHSSPTTDTDTIKKGLMDYSIRPFSLQYDYVTANCAGPRLSPPAVCALPPSDPDTAHGAGDPDPPWHAPWPAPDSPGPWSGSAGAGPAVP